MSFGFSPSDIVALISQATKSYQGWRDACANYSDITSSLDTLTTIPSRLQTHFKPPVQATSSATGQSFAYQEAVRRDLTRIVRSCRRTVDDLNKLLAKYKSLGTNKRKNWDRIRFGSRDINELRVRLTQHVSMISGFLRVVELESIDRLDQNVSSMPSIILDRLPVALGNFIDARVSDSMSARGSIMTTYANDDKHVWRQFRRECHNSGIRSEDIKQNRSALRSFLKDLIASNETVEPNGPFVASEDQTNFYADPKDTADQSPLSEKTTDSPQLEIAYEQEPQIEHISNNVEKLSTSSSNNALALTSLPRSWPSRSQHQVVVEPVRGPKTQYQSDDDDDDEGNHDRELAEGRSELKDEDREDDYEDDQASDQEDNAEKDEGIDQGSTQHGAHLETKPRIDSVEGDEEGISQTRVHDEDHDEMQSQIQPFLEAHPISSQSLCADKDPLSIEAYTIGKNIINENPDHHQWKSPPTPDHARQSISATKPSCRDIEFGSDNEWDYLSQVQSKKQQTYLPDRTNPPILPSKQNRHHTSSQSNSSDDGALGQASQIPCLCKSVIRNYT